MKKAIVTFPDEETREQAKDLVHTIIEEMMSEIIGPVELAAMTLPTRDGGSIVAYSGPVLPRLDEAKIPYRREGLDELRNRMDREDYETLETFMGVNLYT